MSQPFRSLSSSTHQTVPDPLFLYPSVVTHGSKESLTPFTRHSSVTTTDVLWITDIIDSYCHLQSDTYEMVCVSLSRITNPNTMCLQSFRLGDNDDDNNRPPFPCLVLCVSCLTTLPYIYILRSVSSSVVTGT